jgi:hypothetical protein
MTEKPSNRPAPERLAVLRSLPKDIINTLTQDEINSFLHDEVWPDSLREKLSQFTVDEE